MQAAIRQVLGRDFADADDSTKRNLVGTATFAATESCRKLVERDSGRERKRQREREREMKKRERETKQERVRETECQRYSSRGRERQRETELYSLEYTVTLAFTLAFYLTHIYISTYGVKCDLIYNVCFLVISGGNSLWHYPNFPNFG